MRIFKATAIVGVMTLLSRLLGFARDIAFANVFGAGPATDAFFVAFKIPNFLRRLFAEGAFSQAFVPVLSEYRNKYTLQQVRELIAVTSARLVAVLLLITAIVMLFSEQVVWLFAPGFVDEPERYLLAVEMLQLTFPYLIFISLTALTSSILNSYGKFAIPAITPIWLNIIMLAATIWWGAWFEQPIMALAWGVFIAGIAQLLFQLPMLWHLGLLPMPRWQRKHEGATKIFRLMLPAIFGSSVAQINLLFDTILASLLVAGSVSWLYYSDRLVEFPLGIFGVALSTVILPSLSTLHSNADPQRFSATIDWALRWVCIIGVPATAALYLLAQPLLTTLFFYGAFTEHDMQMSSYSLQAYSLGLLGFMFVKVLAPGFYARQDTKTPVRIGIYAILTNIALKLLLVVPLIFLDFSATHAALALTTAIAAWVNAGLLWRKLIRENIYQPAAKWSRFLLQLTIATAVMALIIQLVQPPIATWISHDLYWRGGVLAAVVITGIISYFLVAWLSRMPILQLIRSGQI